jgi:hypothetical protein
MIISDRLQGFGKTCFLFNETSISIGKRSFFVFIFLMILGIEHHVVISLESNSDKGSSKFLRLLLSYGLLKIEFSAVSNRTMFAISIRNRKSIRT